MIKSVMSVLLSAIVISGCTALQGYNHSNESFENIEIEPVQLADTRPANYVKIIDELISNGCDISRFEMVERHKVLDMKIACK